MRSYIKLNKRQHVYSRCVYILGIIAQSLHSFFEYLSCRKKPERYVNSIDEDEDEDEFTRVWDYDTDV